MESEDEQAILYASSPETIQDAGEAAESNELLLETTSEDSIAPIEEPPYKKRMYSCRREDSGTLTFLSLPVCAQAHKRLYGIGSAVLQNLRNSLPGYTMHDRRMQEPKHELLGVSLKRQPRTAKWPQILSFFWIIYISQAEILPYKFNMPSGRLVESFADTDPDFQERYTCGFIQDVERNFDIANPDKVGPGSFQGPRRFLEHSTATDLFYQYCAHSEANRQDAACFSTFLRVLKQVFKSHLKFREKAEFGVCNVCYGWKMRIKRASSKADQTEAVKGYTRHLLAQWLDRQVYWKLRALSRAIIGQALRDNQIVMMQDLATSVMTAIMDGMDQAKLRVPRHGYKRITKNMEKLFRPSLHLSATWLHGHLLHLAVADEDMKKNSESQLEMLARALSQMHNTFGRLPLCFHLQQDNCFREGKNQYMASFALMLTILGVFRATSLGFLRTAHSHEDVDQVFGQVARLLMGKCFGTANEMVNLLNETARQRGAATSSASRIQGSSCKAYKLDEVTCWKEWVSQIGIVCKGMRRVHYIRFLLRRDLGMDILNNVSEMEDFPVSGRLEKHPDDIFLLAKRWLADSAILRLVALVPASKAAEIRTGARLPTGVAPRRAISDQVAQNLRKTVPICCKSGELSRDAAKYLLDWCSGSLPRVPKPSSYEILNHRWDHAMSGEALTPGTWQPPRRRRNVDLTLEAEEGFDDSDEDSQNEHVDLPQALHNA